MVLGCCVSEEDALIFTRDIITYVLLFLERRRSWGTLLIPTRLLAIQAPDLK
jgi:hypothetical protein